MSAAKVVIRYEFVVMMCVCMPNVQDQRRPKGVRCIAWLGAFIHSAMGEEDSFNSTPYNNDSG